MKSATLHGSLLPLALALAAAASYAQEELQTTEGGQPRRLTLAADELHVRRAAPQPGGVLKQTLEGRLAGARVLHDTGARAVVKLGAAYDRGLAASRRDPVARLFPDADVAPVYYVQGQPAGRESRRIGTREVMVTLKPGQTAEEARQIAGGTAVRETRIEDVVIVSFPNAFHAMDGLRALQARGVESEPMLQREMQKLTLPADQYFSEQWHLFNTGQRGALVGVDVNAVPAWDNVNLGTGVTIAIVDDCLETSHPDLRDNCPLVSTHLHHDFNDNDDDPRPVTANNDGHGTSVAGLAAARQNNGIFDPATGFQLGVSGVAPEARLLGLRLIAGPISDQQVADALYWHPEGANVGVSNNSWGFGVTGTTLRGLDVLTKAALREAAINGRDGKGQVTVFSAGNSRQGNPLFNDNTNYSGLTNSRFVVTVAALNAGGTYSPYSTPGASILVCAPGGGYGFLGSDQRLVTTDVAGTAGFSPSPGDILNTDYTRQMNGTSAAAPIVSGTVALMLAANSALSWRDVKEILAATAKQVDQRDGNGLEWLMRPALPLGEPDRLTNGGGFKFNHNYGAGLVDAFAASVRALTWINLGPEEVQSRVRNEVLNDNAAFIPNNANAPPFTRMLSGRITDPNLRLEQIEVELRVSHSHAEELEVSLKSPTGVTSLLTRNHTVPPGGIAEIGIQDTVLDFATLKYKKRTGGWVYSTVRHWGENSDGPWTVQVADKVTGVGAGAVLSAAIRFYGTRSGKQRLLFSAQKTSLNKPTVAVDQPITIRRLDPTGARAGTLTVEYATTASNAKTDIDYVAKGGTVTFLPGQEFATINISILPNNLPQSTRTVNVVLRNPQGGDATGPVSLGGITLIGIDIIDTSTTTVSVVATDAKAAETNQNEPPKPGTFTITRSKADAIPLTVNFAISGTAQAGFLPDGTGDYVPLAATSVTIAPNEKTATVTIDPRDDPIQEGTETVILTILPDPTVPALYMLGNPDNAVVEIADNDLPKIQIITVPGRDLAQETFVVPPPITGLFSISRTSSTSSTITIKKPVLVKLDFGGSQLLGKNYKLTYVDKDGILRELTDPTNSTVLIPANQDVVDLTLVPLNDAIYQATKSVEVILRPDPDYEVTFGFFTRARANILEDDPLPDTRIPTVTITSPRRGADILSPAVVLASGRATDNHGVESVLYRINRGVWNTVSGVASGLSVEWSVNLAPPVIALGPNTLEVISTDSDGNESQPVAVDFDYVKQHTLGVTLVGGGTVTRGFAPTSQREVGKPVSLTATPAAGQVFSGWSGSVPGFPNPTPAVLPATTPVIDRTLAFTMPDADANLVATFVDSPFVTGVAGTYCGLVQANFLFIQSSGLLQVVLAPTGVFTGKVILGGVTYPLRGEFNGSGQYHGFIARKNEAPYNLDLAVTLAPGSARRITGTIKSNIFTANVSADRAAFSRTIPPPAELVRSYTFYFAQPPASTGGGVSPRGFGWGTLKIDAIGMVRWTGQLPDGTRATQAVPLAADRTWPFFLSLYANKGVMLGQVTHDAAPSSDFNAALDWFKPTIISDKYFTNGFSIDNTALKGAPYTPPATGNRVLQGFANTIPNGVLGLEEGNLLLPIPKDVTLSLDNKVTIALSDLDKLAITVSPSLGTFTGHFIHPVSAKTTVISGILFQKENKGYGFFPGTSVENVDLQTGRVILQPK